MILAQLSFLDFDAPGDAFHGMRLGEMALRPEWEVMVHIGRELDLKKALFEAAARSPRFKDILPYGYRSALSETAHKQFSAVTFLVEPHFSVVSFRGTDSTVIGWKENFDMSTRRVSPPKRQAPLI